jgi:hypothetical protein
MNSDEFEPWIAIRYLGGILASRSFWIQQPHSNHEIVTEKLFQRGKQLVEDMDIERWAKTDILLRKICGDVEGIDILTCTSRNLVSAKRASSFGSIAEELPAADGTCTPVSTFWINLKFNIHCSYSPAARHLLPQSYDTVSSEYVMLIGMSLQCEPVEVLDLCDTYASTF